MRLSISPGARELNIVISAKTPSMITNGSLPPERTRKLLLHKHEILKLQYKVKKEKAAIIPNLVYLSKDKIKVEICLCKSKKDHDKREDIKKRDNQREMKKYY